MKTMRCIQCECEVCMCIVHNAWCQADFIQPDLAPIKISFSLSYDSFVASK